jgi:DNA-binding MarR family transcriptional regulator
MASSRKRDGKYAVKLIISTTDDQPIRRLDPVSTQIPDGAPRGGQPPAEMADRLGYLLKHVQLRFSELSAAVLAPTGINGREAAVLRTIDSPHPLAQGEIARRMGIDRTTMVALIDDLQARGLVQRRPDPDDRRKNVVELTGAGGEAARQAAQASEQVERIFLGPLTASETEKFKKTLRTLLYGRPVDPG